MTECFALQLLTWKSSQVSASSNLYRCPIIPNVPTKDDQYLHANESFWVCQYQNRQAIKAPLGCTANLSVEEQSELSLRPIAPEPSQLFTQG